MRNRHQREAEERWLLSFKHAPINPWERLYEIWEKLNLFLLRTVSFFKWTGNHYGKIGDAMVLLTRASSTENGVGTVLHVQDVCMSGFFCWHCQTQIIVWSSADLFAEFTYFYKIIPAGWWDEISYWCKTSNIPHGCFFCISRTGELLVHRRVPDIHGSFCRSFPGSVSAALVLPQFSPCFTGRLCPKEQKTPTSLFLFLLTPTQYVCLCLWENYIEIGFFVNSSLLFIGGDCHIRVKLELSQPERQEEEPSSRQILP